MFLTFVEFLWWLQPEATAPSSGGGAAGGAGPQGCAMQVGMFAVLMLVMWFFMMRPEEKRRKEHQAMLAALRKGVKVRTQGGLLGEVVSLGEDDVVIQVADRVRINVLRSHISTLEEARIAQARKEAAGAKAKPKSRSDRASRPLFGRAPKGDAKDALNDSSESSSDTAAGKD